MLGCGFCDKAQGDSVLRVGWVVELIPHPIVENLPSAAIFSGQFRRGSSLFICGCPPGLIRSEQFSIGCLSDILGMGGNKKAIKLQCTFKFYWHPSPINLFEVQVCLVRTAHSQRESPHQC